MYISLTKRSFGEVQGHLKHHQESLGAYDLPWGSPLILLVFIEGLTVEAPL